MVSYCIWWMSHQPWKLYPSKMAQSTMVIQQTYLLSCFVKTSSKFTSAGCSLVLQIFSLVTLLTWDATIIILGCQEVGQNETFIAPQRAYYLSGRKGKCYPSPNPSFCSHFPLPPPSCTNPPLSLFTLCVSNQWNDFPSLLQLPTFSSSLAPDLPSFLPPSFLYRCTNFEQASTWDHVHIFISQGM